MRGQGHPYSFISLLGSLVILFLLTPFFSGLTGRVLFNLAFTGFLLSAIASLSERKGSFYLGLLLGGLSVGFQWANFLITGPLLSLAAAVSPPLFLGFTIFFISKKIFYSFRVEKDLVYGAISLYFLIGIFWAVLYYLIEREVPGSFQGVAPVGPELISVFSDFLYFSFTTLTTLGYGDVVAVNPFARNLAVIEAVFGQFYIATLVAGLIGLLIRDRAEKRSH